MEELSILDIFEAYLLNPCGGEINEDNKLRLLLFCDEIAGSVYKTRYRLRYKPSYLEKRNECGAAKLQFQQISSDVVEYDEYFVSCWENMTTKLTGIHFGTEIELKRYLYTVFNHDLEQMIYDLTPGLQTRVDQIKQILPQICEEVRKKEWILKTDYRLKDLPGCNDEVTGAPLPKKNKLYAPPSAQSLINSEAVNIPTPKMTYTREKSDRGPSIKKEEMQQYLINVFNAAGGVIQEKQLIEFIKHMLCLKSIDEMKVNPYPKDDEQHEIDPMDQYADTSQYIINSQSHMAIAQAILFDMNSRQRRIIQLLLVKNMDQTTLAKILGVSNATVSGEMKNIRNIIKKYIDEHMLSEAECRETLDILIDLIEKETNYEKEIH